MKITIAANTRGEAIVIDASSTLVLARRSAPSEERRRVQVSVQNSR